MVRFVRKNQITELLHMSGSTLKKYRAQGCWIEGIDWIKLNSRCIRYNFELLQDWLHNQNDPAAHQKAIDHYQASLLSNQPQRRRKKPK